MICMGNCKHDSKIVTNLSNRVELFSSAYVSPVVLNLEPEEPIQVLTVLYQEIESKKVVRQLEKNK